MDEKIIIKSKLHPVVKTVCLSLAGLGLILGFFLVINSPEVGEYSNPYSYKYGDDFDWGYLFTSIIPFYFSFSFLPLAIIPNLTVKKEKTPL